MKFLFILSLGITLLFGLVDINSANKDKLMTLKGIGEHKAEAILTYRKKFCFKEIDELVRVKGIGLKIIKNNRDHLTAKACKEQPKNR